MNYNNFKYYDMLMRTNRSVTIPPDGSSSDSLIRVVPKKCKGCKHKTPICHFRVEACEKNKHDRSRGDK